VLSTGSAQAAGRLAALANVLLIRGPADTSLAGADPAAAVLAGTTLDGTTLDGTTLAGTTLDGTTLDGTTLDGATLDGATLDGTVLAGDQFALVIRSQEQQVPRGRFVPGRIR
jgi:uncharacterized protein YjbI with pentapeptide repeats